MIKRNFTLKSTESCFLLGPRGTGKTTWLKSEFPEACYLDLLESRLLNTLSADPQRLMNFLPAQGGSLVIVDEVQKLPALLDEVHRLMETRGLRFILTGSSARKLKRSGVNLLGGRAMPRTFPPLTADELGKDFDLARAMKWGMLPTLYDQAKEEDPEKYLNAYVRIYINEEVMQEGLTRNAGHFSRFLEAASFSQAQLLNITAVARECQINRKVVESYFDILGDLLLAERIPVFQRRAKRTVTQHPKFFFFDAGVFRALRPGGPLDSAEEIDGPALETLVHQHLRAFLARTDPTGRLYYWRTQTGLEVDFVVYSPHRFLAIEVKRRGKITRHDLKGLRSFGEEYPEARRILLCGENRRQVIDDVEIWPVEQALQHPESLLAYPES